MGNHDLNIPFGARRVKWGALALGVWLAAGCSAPRHPDGELLPGVVGRNAGAYLLENHGAAYTVWHATGVRGATLVHLDAHDDCRYIVPEKLAELDRLVAARRYGEIHRRTDHFSFSRFEIPKMELLYNLGDFIYPCIADGTVRTFYWVVPEREVTMERAVALQRHLSAVLHADPLLDLAPLGDGGFSFRLLGARVVVCTLEALPRQQPGALLDIDLDYFADPNALSSQHLAGSLTRDPVAVCRRLRQVVPDPAVTTVSYSMWGGYLPTDLRFLGPACAQAVAGKGYPEAAKALLRAAVALRGGGEIDEAVFRDLPDPFAAAGAYVVGVARLTDDDPGRARDAFEKAAGLDAGYRKAFLDTAAALVDRGEGSTAMVWLDRYRYWEGSDSVEESYLRALALLAAGKAEAADPLSADLLEWSEEPEVLILRGRVLVERGDSEGAAVLYGRVLEKKRNPEALYRLGWLEMKRGREEEAAALWFETSVLSPHFEQVDYNLGLYLLGRGEVGRAQSYLEEAARLSPKDPDVWNALGSAEASGGRFVEARMAFERAVSLAPDHPGGRANLARLKALASAPRVGSRDSGQGGSRGP